MFETSNTDSTEFQAIGLQPRRSAFKRTVAILSAITITVALMFGYLFLRRRHAERLRTEQALQNPVPKPIPSPMAQVFADEAMIKGSQAVIGGTLQNISPDKLTALTIEIELKRRKDGGSEVRVLTIEPRDLDPGQQGRYALNVPSREYRESHIQRIKAGQASGEVPFKVLPGVQRPDERLPTKTIIVSPSPTRRGKGEEFINTPDNPVSVP